MRHLPMFPLGTVLVPHMVLPLHVFEPRYRALVHDVLATDRELGVTLIARGNEVGGGDERTDVGTVAQVLQANELDDGRWVLMTVGTERIDVVRWLEDDPYPRAQVSTRIDEADGGDLEAGWRQIEPLLRRVLAMQSELGELAVPATVTFSDDPVEASWEAAAIAPIGLLDLQELLRIDGPGARLDALATLLAGAEEALAFRLGVS